jgi:hypothetical protein
MVHGAAGDGEWREEGRTSWQEKMLKDATKMAGRSSIFNLPRHHVHKEMAGNAPATPLDG